MKTLIGTLLVLALGFSIAVEGQSTKKTRDQSATGPRIEITPEDHDFGRVEQNLKLEKEFEIENVGTEDLIIKRVSTTCGCTAALTSDRIVKPGQTTILKVTFETRRYKGPVQRKVSVATNDPRRIKTVTVKAIVEETDKN